MADGHITPSVSRHPGWYDVHGDVRLSWEYPKIYAGDTPSRITLDLSSVRAADSIGIEFDATRDGWVIRMDRTRHHDNGGYIETVAEMEEVAFIPAWNEESVP